MRCPERESWLAIVIGEPGERRRRRCLEHAERCEECREELEAARRAVRVGFPALARGVGWTPADPDRRAGEILAGVRAGREKVGRGRLVPSPWARRRLPVAMAVGVVVVLGILTARFLGEERWNGCLELARGTFLLVDDDGEFRAAADGAEVGPGRIVLAPPGGGGSIVAGPLGRVTLHGPALVVLGDGEDRPALWIARGAVEVEAPAGGSVRVGTGGPVAVVAGRAEFSIRPKGPAAALAFARDRAGEEERAGGFLGGLLGVAHATPAPGPANPDGDGAVHCLTGEVRFPGGTLRPGEEAPLDAVHDARWSGLEATYGLEGSGRLTSRESEVAKALLAGHGENAVESLLRAAADRHRAAEDRALAVWLLAEVGDETAIPGLVRVFEDGETPPAVRAAVVRTLGVLGDRDMVVSAKVLRDEVGRDPVVLEALVTAYGRTGRPEVRGNLVGYLGEADLPTFARVLAAVALAAAGDEPLPAEALVALLRTPDEGGAVAPAVTKLLLDAEGGHAALLELARAAGPAQAHALSVLADGMVAGAESAAEAAILGVSSPELAASAFWYLTRVDGTRAVDLALAALPTAEGTRLRSALVALAWRSGRFEKPDWLVRRLKEIVSDPANPEEIVVPAMTALGADGDRARLIEIARNDTFSLRDQALEHLFSVARTDPGFARSEAYRTLLRSLLADRNARVREAVWGSLGLSFPADTVALADDWLRTAPVPLRPEVVHGLNRVVAGRTDPDLRERACGLLTTVFVLCDRWTDRQNALSSLAIALAAGSPRAEAGLRELFARDDLRDQERGRIVRALAGSAPIPPSRLELAEWIDGPPEIARVAAAAVLSRPRTTEVLAFGRRLAGSARSPLGRFVAAALENDVERMARLLDEASDELWELAVSSLGHEQLRPLAGPLAARLGTGSRGFRVLGTFKLALTGEEIDHVRTLEEDGDLLVRFAAKAGLRGASGGPSERELDALAEQIRERDLGRPRMDLDLTLSIRALNPVRALESRIAPGWSQPPDAERRLVTASNACGEALRARRRLSSPGSAGKVFAVETLGRTGTRADVYRLIELLLAGDEELAAAANAALADLTGRSFEFGRAAPEASEWWESRSFALDVPLVRRRD